MRLHQAERGLLFFLFLLDVLYPGWEEVFVKAVTDFYVKITC